MTRNPAGYHQGDQRPERGIALVTTILIITVMGLLAGVALMAAAGGVSVARQDDSQAAALGAADAGVDDIIYRLNASENTSFQLAENIYSYDQQLRSNSSTVCPTADIPALPPASCGWVTMPNSNDSARALEYEYSVPANHEPSPTGSATTSGATGSSSIVVDVSGRIISLNGQTITRSVRVVLARSTFLNYGYFTNVDTQDPQQYDLDPALPGWPEFGSYGGTGIQTWSGPTTQASQPQNAYDAALEYCQNYWFEGNPTPSETAAASGAGVTISQDPRAIHSETNNGYNLNNICTFTRWEGGDTFYGPVRTNDVLSINGSTNFYGPVQVGTPCNMLTSANPGASQGGCPTGVLGEGTAYSPGAGNNDGQGVYWIDTQPILFPPGVAVNPNFSQPPSYAPPVNMPPGNPTLAQQASTSGCLYEGMTYFDFLSTGSVYVYSPGTAAAVTAGAFTLNAGCSTNGNVVLSSHPVLYVERASSTTACLDGTAGDYTFGGLVQNNDYYPGVVASSDSGGALRQWKYGTSPAVDPRAFACNNGDAWVGGVVGGSVTVGAANNIVVYQNLTYASTTYSINATTVTASGSDVLGLEPSNDVVVYHPVDCASWDSPGTSCVPSNSATNDFGSSCPTGQATTWAHGNAATAADCQVNQIDGAILAFNGEYTAENYTFGAGMGTLAEFGSVSQAYRGRLANTSGASGYSKEYLYDPRLATLSPPSFLPPGLFDWTEATWAEVTGQVKAITPNTETVPVSPTAPVPTAPTYTVPPNTTTTTSATTTTTSGGTTTTAAPTTTTTVPTTTTTVPTTTTTVPTTTTTHPTTNTTVPTTTTTMPTTTTTTATAPSFPAQTTLYCFANDVDKFYPGTGSSGSGTFTNTPLTSFTVTANGNPAPALSAGTYVNNFNSYFVFTNNGNGTGTVTWNSTAPGNQNGFAATITASNGKAPNATETITIDSHSNYSHCS